MKDARTDSGGRVSQRWPHEKCETCWAWTEGSVHAGYGICRGGPPTADERGDGQWPRTNPYDWCGEWRQKQVPANDWSPRP